MRNKYKKYRFDESAYQRTVPRQKIKEIGTVLLFCILLPYVVATLSGRVGNSRKALEKESVYILLTDENGTERIPLNKYLIGAMAASIDTSMEEETLKAQAVILRTNVWEAYGRRKDKSTDYIMANELSMEYYSVWKLQKSWLEEFEKKYSKLERIVQETDGVIITYQGIPVQVPYFYVSAGETRNGKDVFEQAACPYLVSVESLQDFYCMEYGSSVLYPKRYFLQKISALFGVTEEEIAHLDELVIKRDEAEYVQSVRLKEKEITGEAVREAFLLNSSHFTWEERKDGILISVQGIGHGVGLSQFGANEMAKEGKTYDALLKHYYQGIEIEKN